MSLMTLDKPKSGIHLQMEMKERNLDLVQTGQSRLQ